jgi:hypothetical protein
MKRESLLGLNNQHMSARRDFGFAARLEDKDDLGSGRQGLDLIYMLARDQPVAFGRDHQNRGARTLGDRSEGPSAFVKHDNVHPAEAQSLSCGAAMIEVMLHEKNGRDIGDIGHLGAA